MFNDCSVFSGVTPVCKGSNQACSNQILEAVFLLPGGSCNWRFPEDVLAYFQPIYSVYQERIVGVEALARVRASSGEILSPMQFLPSLSLAQRRELSRQMLLAGITLLETLDAKGISLDLSFNVDPDFMEDQDCVPCFLGVLGGTSITPQRITLELLESGDFLQGDIAVRRLQALRDTGANIALDDIGSAYSSLLRLKNLPIQKIKLDQELVRDLEREPKIMAFLQSMKFLADGLGATLIVEGVETATILDAVAQRNLPVTRTHIVKIIVQQKHSNAARFILEKAGMLFAFVELCIFIFRIVKTAAVFKAVMHIIAVLYYPGALQPRTVVAIVSAVQPVVFAPVTNIV